MAKGKSKNRGQRDTSAIATQRVLGSSPSPLPPVHVTPADRTILRPSPPAPVQDDRRTFHPLGQSRPVKTISGTNAGYKLKDRVRKVQKIYRAGRSLLLAPKRIASQTKAVLSFADPSHVAVCIRRKTRRQVLAAFRKFGRGAGSKRRHTPFSRIGC